MRGWILAMGLALSTPAFAGPPGLEGDHSEMHRPPHPDGGPPIQVVQELLDREEELLSFLETQDPKLHQRLMRLKRVDQRAYMGQLMRVERVMERSKSDPDVLARHLRMAQIEASLDEKADVYGTLSGKERRSLRAEMEMLTVELFELRQAERRATLQSLEERMERLRGEIDERESDRENIVDAYLDQLLQTPVDL